MTGGPQERLRAILNRLSASIIAPAGLAKRGSTFCGDRGDLSWLIDVQKSRWNDTSKVEFTVNCGIYVRGVVGTYLGRSDPQSPSMTYCCISARVGMLMPGRLDVWWRLRADDDPSLVDAQVEAGVGRAVSVFCLPFLGRFRDRQDVVAYLEQPRAEEERQLAPGPGAQALAYAAVVCRDDGDKERAADLLDRAVIAAAGTPLEDHIGQLRRCLVGEKVPGT